MIDLVFATNNSNKLKEVKELLPSKINLLGLKDIGCNEDLSETQTTLEGNALQKARYVYDKYNINCFADDTGLEIDALDGRPGVYSARYAGEGKNAGDNMNKVLLEMNKMKNRKANFKTIISLMINNKEYLFEGLVYGNILTEKKGQSGFGYDPVFQPEGYNKSFAEMNLEEKNKISHRAIAVKKLIEFLEKL